MTIFAIIFPGQGSQRAGMLLELEKNYSVVRATFKEASSVLGYDLWKMIQQDQVGELNKTWHTQPALLTASVAIWRIWRQRGGKMPSLMAGHSLGEYSALVCSGSLNLTDAVELVAFRGKIMQDAVPEEHGAMSAIIGLDGDTVLAVCKQASQGQVVSPVNFNTPKQVVIAGHKDAVNRASVACKKAGAKYTLLPISVPSHCILMKPAVSKLKEALEIVKFSTPQVPVINNVDVCAEQDPDSIRQALVRQLYSPVRWAETIEFFATQGIKVLLEMGPGAVLTRLARRTVSTLSSIAVHDVASLDIAIKQNWG